jgi:hypothetical protein
MLNVTEGEMGCFRDNPGGGKCSEAVWGAKKGRITQHRQQERLQPLTHCSPGYALIEFAFGIRLGWRVAGNAFFIEKDAYGVAGLPAQGVLLG